MQTDSLTAISPIDGRYASKVEQRINQRTRMPARENETITAIPLRVLRVDIQVTQPQGAGKIGHTHGHTRMPRLGLFNHIRAQAADSIRYEF